MEPLVAGRAAGTRTGPSSRRPAALPLSGIAGIAFFLAVWWVASLGLGATRLPSPWATAQALVASSFQSDLLRTYGAGNGGFWPHILYSVQTAALGVTLGVVAGVGLGLLMWWSRRARLFFTLEVELARTIPPLAAIPFFLMWFGTGQGTQLGVIVFFSALRLVIFTVEAIRGLPPVYQQFAATLGASRLQLLRTVMLPSLVPELIGAIRVTIATAWGVEVVAELMGATMGVGKVFNVLSMLLATADIVALVVWLAIIAIVVDLAFVWFARRVTRWLPS